MNKSIWFSIIGFSTIVKGKDSYVVECARCWRVILFPTLYFVMVHKPSISTLIINNE